MNLKTSGMNILVTGANGQLGMEMRRVSAGSGDRYVFTDVCASEGGDTAILDITDADAVEDALSGRGPVGALFGCEGVGAVINCAAYTNVDKAEDDVRAAEMVNTCAVANLARSASRNGAVLVHISTDYVFGGNLNNTPCREDEPANPTGVYGLTKLRGEEAVAESGCRHIIIRTAWLYSEFGRNFLKTMLRLTAEKSSLDVVFDQTGSPTYAYDLAEAIFRIIDGRLYEGRDGIYHYSNEGVCSWYDFTKMIAEYSGHTACDIRPCHSSEFPSRVIRPSYSVLDKTKIKSAFGLRIPYWTDSLRRCIAALRTSEAD